MKYIVKYYCKPILRALSFLVCGPIECVKKLQRDRQRDQNNPFFQRFSTGFDVLTTNTSPLDPVVSFQFFLGSQRGLGLRGS